MMIVIKIEIDGEEALTIDNEYWCKEDSSMLDEAIALLQIARQHMKEQNDDEEQIKTET